MQPAPIPADDDARLAELRSYGLLDTPADPAFDDIGHLARAIAGTPIGIVSLVDENRQWFKTCIGLDARETPRTISFCGHTILQRQPLIVEDALADPRFRDNPLVLAGPRIRFYAGFPLVSANGMNLGSLCAVDTRPRQLDAAQVDALQRLARQTVKLMELGRETQLLAASQRQRQQQRQPATPTAPRQLVSHQAEALLRSLELMVGQDSQPCFAVLRIGLKDLPRLQSTLGSAAAERLRISCAERLSAMLPSDASTAWFASSELVALLPYASSEAELALLAGGISRQLEEPLAVEGRLLSTQVAIGVALYKGNYTSAEALLADAAIAQRIARGQPGSHFSFIDLATRLQAQADIGLEASLRQALRNDDLEPYFQPLVQLRDGAVVGLEALLRWQNGGGELMLPARLLAAAERAGLTSQVDLQVIRKALTASHRIAALLPDQPLLLSLNLSAGLLDNAAARQQLLELIERQPLPEGWRLQLELIEDALHQSHRDLEHFLRELRSHGVLVAIDDFGTGYSSLSRLHSYPFHALKLDGSFVRRIDDPQQPSNKLLELMQLLGRDLGLHTTAEGVETDAQRRWLTAQGVDWGQGFLFGPPMPLDALPAYLRQRPRQAAQGSCG